MKVFPALFNVPGLPLSRQIAAMLYEVHEILRKVFHRLGACIRTDVPGRAVFAHRLAVIVRAIKGQLKLSIDYEILMVMGQSMRPFMSEQLAQGTPLIEAEFG